MPSPKAPPSDPAGPLQAPLDEMLAVLDQLSRQPLSADGRAQCDALADAARRLHAAAVDTAQGLAEADGGGVAEPTLLCALLDEVDDAWRGRAADRGGRLAVSYQAEADLLVLVDPERFRGALGALIDAALTAGSDALVEARLAATDSAAGRVRIEASVRTDAGPVLSPERLSAFRRLAETLGASFEQVANPGAGATLRLSLELQRAQVQGAIDAQPEDVGAAPLAQILIVDDNATNRMVAEALCDMFGFATETACDGLEALEAARRRDFDLILMDIRMPNLDGVEATRAIHALGGPAATTPVIALTANADAEAVRGYFAAGMCAVVEKPIKPERLLEAIQAALDGSPGEQVAAITVAA